MVKRYTKNEINELSEILKRDGVISVPTDTVYGVCARINSPKAYNKLMKLKNRPITKLLPIMCADEEQIKSIAIVDKRAEKLIRTFMPGPITLILVKKSEVPTYFNNGGVTLAVRMATSKMIEELIRRTECPIFMSSANLSGETTCNNLDEIETVFPNLDGMLEGKVSFNEASTIVDCTSEEIKILRSGPITREQILEIFE